MQRVGRQRKTALKERGYLELVAAMARGCGSRTCDYLLVALYDVLRVESVGVDRPIRASRPALGLLILRVICVRYDDVDVVVRVRMRALFPKAAAAALQLR